MRSKSSSKLISENVHNATANLQLTYSVELSPICKDDLLVLPRKLAQSCGNISDVTLCARTTAMVHLLDPVSGQKAELPTDRYWKLPFLPLATSSDMVEFVVLDVEPVDPHELRHVHVGPVATSGRGCKSKFVVADVEVARESDFGVNDTTFHVRTHLGVVLSAGDTVKGYDLSTAIFGSSQTYTLKEELPDVVLVRKVYPRENRHRKGDRKLKTLGASRRGKVSKAETARMEHEMEVFTEEFLEEKDQEEHEGPYLAYVSLFVFNEAPRFSSSSKSRTFASKASWFSWCLCLWRRLGLLDDTVVPACEFQKLAFTLISWSLDPLTPRSPVRGSTGGCQA
ncbi:60S ribosomal export protein NMD3, putative [Phytophthora infestans T30-4]|uniref:60S ribosomal export protein NMD3, putative n=1 Tax=Phytophthora infestans (strain T30-4) TaxID=403677 RepID=D0RMH2_PHYIT|nr:60S ribosomal export protein NMD3, putative [Phytophthora infestans T30-4]EEY63301.1 60S ribosomal export protein NMD3, putative [Phytophthora infestans T30-4]|eukprot:XP_002909758.1 60S ribosomal export protein NMD3, putative [Phytophthora infestans T30-4]